MDKADFSDAVLGPIRLIKYVHLAMAQMAARDEVGPESLDRAKELKFIRTIYVVGEGSLSGLLKQLNMLYMDQFRGFG